MDKSYTGTKPADRDKIRGHCPPRTLKQLLSLKAADNVIAILTALQNLKKKNNCGTLVAFAWALSALDRGSLAPHGALEKLRWVQNSTNKTTFTKLFCLFVCLFSWENLFGPSARENSGRWYKNHHGGDQGGKGYKNGRPVLSGEKRDGLVTFFLVGWWHISRHNI